MTISSVNWLSWATILFDLVKGVAWPLAIFLIVWLFKEPLKQQLPRLKSAGKEGFVFSEPEDQPSARREIGQLNEPDHPLLTVRSVEDSLKANIAELKDEVVVPRLIRALAIAQIERRFEWIFAYVFASQVNFLLSIEGIGLPKNAVEGYYRDVVQPVSKERYGGYTDSVRGGGVISGAI